jgi:hypothetical protein
MMEIKKELTQKSIWKVIPIFLQLLIKLGFMAGNPWTFMPFDNYGAVFYWWTHAVISDATFNGIKNTCK